MPAEDGGDRRGRVYLVGAGPGDPGLLTARALELIARADVILYDRLVGPGALDGARAGAELVFVGKEGGGASVPQEQTEELMVRHALAGRTRAAPEGRRSVRVRARRRGGPAAARGGDRLRGRPRRHRGPGGAGLCGHPRHPPRARERGRARHRAHACRHRGRRRRRTAALDYPALAAFPGTLVFYMGVRALPEIAAALVQAGRPADEPAAVVEAGTLPGQRTITGDARDDRRSRQGGGGEAAVGHGRRAGRRARRRAGVALAAAVVRPQRRRDEGASAGERPRALARRAGRARRGGAGDPHPPAAGPPARPVRATT